MNYPQAFVSLVNRVHDTQIPDLQFVGLGNPCAKILIVGKEAAIDRSTTRGEGCFIMEHLHNAKQWLHNINSGDDLESTANSIPEWSKAPVGEQSYNPLYPYKGQLNKRATRDTDGCVTNGGTSATWCNYQKLIEATFEAEAQYKVIDFFNRTFITEFSEVTTPYSVHSIETKKSIDLRCEQLLSDTFFRQFSVIVVACGHYVRDYKIDLQKCFDQNYIGIEEDKNGWMCIHEKDGRLLIHTRQLSMCPDAIIKKIAFRIKIHILAPFLKYCIYYDGNDKSAENELFAHYERLWCIWSIDPAQAVYLNGNVLEMICHGVPSSWIDSFDIPRTLIGIFFNRYCHWIDFRDVEDFMSWFEDVRNKRIR